MKPLKSHVGSHSIHVGLYAGEITINRTAQPYFKETNLVKEKTKKSVKFSSGQFTNQRGKEEEDRALLALFMFAKVVIDDNMELLKMTKTLALIWIP